MKASQLSTAPGGSAYTPPPPPSKLELALAAGGTHQATEEGVESGGVEGQEGILSRAKEIASQRAVRQRADHEAQGSERRAEALELRLEGLREELAEEEEKAGTVQAGEAQAGGAQEGSSRQEGRRRGAGGDAVQAGGEQEGRRQEGARQLDTPSTRRRVELAEQIGSLRAETASHRAAAAETRAEAEDPASERRRVLDYTAGEHRSSALKSQAAVLEGRAMMLTRPLDYSDDANGFSEGFGTGARARAEVGGTDAEAAALQAKAAVLQAKAMELIAEAAEVMARVAPAEEAATFLAQASERRAESAELRATAAPEREALHGRISAAELRANAYNLRSQLAPPGKETEALQAESVEAEAEAMSLRADAVELSAASAPHKKARAARLRAEAEDLRAEASEMRAEHMLAGERATLQVKAQEQREAAAILRGAAASLSVTRGDCGDSCSKSTRGAAGFTTCVGGAGGRGAPAAQAQASAAQAQASAAAQEQADALAAEVALHQEEESRARDALKKKLDEADIRFGEISGQVRKLEKEKEDARIRREAELLEMSNTNVVEGEDRTEAEVACPWIYYPMDLLSHARTVPTPAATSHRRSPPPWHRLEPLPTTARHTTPHR